MKTLTISVALSIGMFVAACAASPAGEKVAEETKPEQNGPFYTVLWGGGTRIPSIDITTNGTLLAFAQRGGGDNHPNHVEMRRSTDGGKTWAKAVDMNNGKKINHANIAPVVDHETGTVWLFFGERKPVPKGERKAYWLKYCHSDDDGLTWSKVESFNMDGNPVVGLPSCASGIQLSTGRLLLPFTVAHSATKWNVPRTIYSDDHGKTWQFGKEPTSPDLWKSAGSSSEYCLLELADGRVYMSHRYSSPGRCRAIAYSSDGGMTWSNPVQAKDLPQPGQGCHSGLIRLSDPKTEDKSRILFSSPWKGPDGQWAKSYLSRENLTVQISYDECQTWKPLKLIREGSATYSNLIVLPDKSIGCIFESNKPRWQCIHFVRFTLEWLTDGKDKVMTKSE